MTDTTVETMDPELVKHVETDVALLASEAGIITIRTDDELVAAGDFLRDRVKNVLKRIDETFDPIVRAAHHAHKLAVTKKKEISEPLLRAEAKVKRAIADYHAEREREREAARRQAEAEARARAEEERMREAEALEKAGRQQEAVAALERPLEVAAPAMPAEPAPASRGVSVRKVWRYRINDPKAITAPFLCPNEPAIAAIVKSQGLAAAEIVGGIEIYSDSIVSSRSE
jgi:hypothetical protein